jgi:hypothetical protein
MRCTTARVASSTEAGKHNMIEVFLAVTLLILTFGFVVWWRGPEIPR